jgi:chaperone required for assembly of F1-ATPase
MRDIFEDIFAQVPIDPIETAQRSARPQLRRRFYKNAHVDDGGGTGHGFAVRLDGRAVRTPAKRVLEVPVRALAEAIAAEWNAQEASVDPAKMPLTRLANSIIDGVAPAPEPVAAEIEKYLASDLLVYRATGPEGLTAKQEAAWNPLLDWARESLGAEFVLARGINFVAQPPKALRAACAAIPRDPWRLGALSAITTLTGSALIALALLSGQLSAEDAWAAAHVDEDWNMELWGRDALALARRSAQFAEMQAAVLVLEVLRQDAAHDTTTH